MILDRGEDGDNFSYKNVGLGRPRFMLLSPSN